MFPIVSFFFPLSHLFPLSSFFFPNFLFPLSSFLITSYYFLLTTNWGEVYLSPTPLLGLCLKRARICENGVADPNRNV